MGRVGIQTGYSKDYIAFVYGVYNATQGFSLILIEGNYKSSTPECSVVCPSC